MRTHWTKDEIMRYLLSIDKDFSDTYYFKEKNSDFSKTADYNTCDEDFDELI